MFYSFGEGKYDVRERQTRSIVGTSLIVSQEPADEWTCSTESFAIKRAEHKNKQQQRFLRQQWSYHSKKRFGRAPEVILA